MRVRLQSSLPDVVLGCWYEIPQNPRSAYIEDLIQQLHSDLDLEFPSSELGLDLADYDLPRRSRIEGILREGDILNLKHIVQTEISERSPSIHNQLSRGPRYNPLEDVERSSRELQRVQRSRSGRRSFASAQQTPQEVNIDDASSLASVATSTEGLDKLRLRRKVRQWRLRSAALQEAFERLEKDTIRQANALSSIEHGTEEQARVSDGVIKGLEEQIKRLEQENRGQTEKVGVLLEQFEQEQFERSRQRRLQTTLQARSQRASRKPANYSEDTECEDEFIVVENNPVEVSIDTPRPESCQDSSSVVSSSSEDSEDSSSSGEVEVLSSKQPASQMHTRTPTLAPNSGLPHQGSPATSHRNDRRKRARTLQRLIEAGTLPLDSNFKTLEKYLEVRDQGADAVKEWQTTIFATAAKHPTPVNGHSKIDQWHYPSEPEEGWEKRLVVKEIECESMHTEERVSVKQYTEAQRQRKRLRDEEVSEDNTQPQRQRRRSTVHERVDDDADFDADMYGNADIVSRENDSANIKDTATLPIDTIEHDLEDGEVESDGSDTDSSTSASDSSSEQEEVGQMTNGTVPSLPSDIGSLPVLTLDSRHLTRPGTVIAFKHMEMVNFRPSFSEYKTGRILKIQGELLVLQLAEADVQEAMYDYEGDRVPGPFDYWDEGAHLVDGQIAIHRGELMDPLLVQGLSG